MSEKKIIVNKNFNPQIANAVLRKNWYWPLIFIAITVCISYFYLRYTKPVYEASSVIQIDNKDQGREILEIENVNSKNNLSSQIELFRSQFLFQKTIKSLNLPVSIFNKGSVLTDELYPQTFIKIDAYILKDSSLCNIPILVNFKEDNQTFSITYTHHGRTYNYPFIAGKLLTTPDFDIKITIDNAANYFSTNKSNEIYFVFNDPNVLADRLMSGLLISPLNLDAQTIEVKYKSTNKVLCKEIVEKLIQSFFEYDEILKKKSSENILNFLKSQLDSLSSELKNSKDSLINFQRLTKINDPEKIESNINENINKLSDELFLLQSDLSTLNLIANKLKNDPDKIDVYRILPEMMGKSFEQSLLTQTQDLHQLLEKKDDLLIKLKPDNSDIININTRIKIKLQSIRNSITIIQERYLQNIQAVKSKMSDFEQQFGVLPTQRMELNRLRSMQDLNEKYYSILTEKKAQYSISNAGYSPSSRILNNAKLPEIAVNPNKKMIYIAFFMLGLLIGTALIIIKYLTYDEINSPQELKSLLPNGINFIGTIPQISSPMEFSQLLVDTQPNSILSEYFRSVRSNLSFINPKARTIAVTSSISGEGKTFVSLNLAGIIALSGKKTIIIDLDLRKPKIHLGLGTENKIGISNILFDLSLLNQSIKKTRIPQLDFITSGSIPPNPSELILSQEFQQLIEKLKEIYDVIILDTPPVGIVSDSIPIIAQVDIPIYVFKANYSKRTFIEKIEELVEVQKIKQLNVILNGITSSRHQYGYGKKYGQGYYHEDTSSNKSKNILKTWFKKN